MRQRYNPPIIAGRVNSNGTLAMGEGFSVRRSSLGNYILTFPPDFHPISVVAGAITAGATATCNIWTPDNNVNIATLSFAGAAADIPFAFIAVGAA